VPWASFGFPLADSAFLPLASSVGESGLVIIAVCMSAAIYSWWHKSPSTPIILSVLLITAAVATTSPAPAPTSSLSCLVIQPSVGVHEKNDQMYAEEFFRIQYDLSVAAMREHPQFDLMLWAETMWPLPAVDEGQQGTIIRPWPGEPDEVVLLSTMSYLQRKTVAYVMENAPLDSYFLTGSHFYYAARDGEHSDRSSDFILFDKSGSLLQHFSKSKLVPFGETLPFSNNFPGSDFCSDFAQQYFGLRPDFILPEARGPLKPRKGMPSLGGAVCWENVFEQPFRQQAAAGATAFAVLSNEDWLGDDGLEMTQMISASKLRAVETGRALLRATNTGQTCVVLADGSVVLGPEILARDYWLAELPIVDPDFMSAYVKYGWLLAPIWAIICLILLIQSILSQRALDVCSKKE
jgi:apolipoprotein N-acyltransferase